MDFRSPDTAESFNAAVLRAMPVPVFVVHEDLSIRDCNEAAEHMFAAERKQFARCHSGEAMHCVHAAGGCGAATPCNDCVVRQCINDAFQGRRMVRQRTTLDLVQPGGAVTQAHYLVTASPFEHEGSHYVMLVLEDVTELFALRDLLPICAHCKKVRDDQQYWHALESYLTNHHKLGFTHSICPACVEKHFPEVTLMHLQSGGQEMSGSA
jgi:hypothetical protein